MLKETNVSFCSKLSLNNLEKNCSHQVFYKQQTKLERRRYLGSILKILQGCTTQKMKNFAFLLLILLMSAFGCIGYNSYIMSKTQNATTVGNTGATGNTGNASDTGTPDNAVPGNPANTGTPSNPINAGANSQTIQLYVTSYGFN